MCGPSHLQFVLALFGACVLYLNLCTAFFNSGADNFFSGVDQFMPKVVELVTARNAKSPSTELVLNEFIPVVQDW